MALHPLNVIVKIHPVALFSIVDSYERRPEEAKRVIGTLLGTREKNVIEVTDCFTVPHNETDQEVCIDVDYASNMLDLIRRGLGSGAPAGSVVTTATPSSQLSSSHLVVVGWFAGGALELTEYSALIHDYYVREAAAHSKSSSRHEPVHLIVDTRLTNSRLNIQAFVRRPMGLPGSKSQGSLFAPIRVVAAADDSAVGSLGSGIGERSILHFLSNCMRNTSDPMNCVVTLPSRPELQTLVQGVQQLHGMLERLLSFAEAAADGGGPADAATGRAVAALLARLSRLQMAPLEEALSTNVKDLLMLVFLADLLRSQLSIHERLVLT